MIESIQTILNGLRTRNGVSITQIETAQEQLKVIFPEEFREFLQTTDGAEGPIGSWNYIQLWSLERIVSRNQGGVFAEFIPGLILFGSDGGNEAYGFDLRNPQLPIINVPFVGMDRKSMTVLAETFFGFLEKLAGE